MSYSSVQWPPELSEEQRNALIVLATTYSLSHSLLYLPQLDSPPFAPTSAIHAPFSLLPTPFPRFLFERAKRLQNLYNVLYARVALDVEFLDRVMGAEIGVGKVDSFTRDIWTGWKQAREEGFTQPLHLGIFRSDYLLHLPPGASTPGLKQVEFNTISSSFGALSEQVAKLHRHLVQATDYYGVSPILKAANVPPNSALSGIVEGLFEAYKAVGDLTAAILFVVLDGERNIFDQRLLEYELLEQAGIKVVRQSMKQLKTSATLEGKERYLRIKTDTIDTLASVVYFRATYAPNVDLQTRDEVETRILLERSFAIKCPSLQLQLAGGKRVQQELTAPGVLEHFLPDHSPSDLTEIRDSWMTMWSLDAPSLPDFPSTSGFERARQYHPNLVLKPQREGGGNNIYKTSIPPFLDTLPEEEREAWIAMELIQPPQDVHNWLVRAGGANDGAHLANIVSELGVYGWALFGEGREVQEKEVGWLLRTKGKESDEGGIAVGYSVLDSVVLTD
ncbi:glutathione synthase [Sistotremastrum suecicum HHB10207 ss-3]|uniref:Glutathione synthetase n=1 Tax=Sistotremastrum suecicum HHB10207 ss-3 TaxID=1314776 RepID=A0A166I422_9AGAM|nr:glutathione synthase [Sistotremastrum suecicum HHB10207 ss-3]